VAKIKHSICTGDKMKKIILVLAFMIISTFCLSQKMCIVENQYDADYKVYITSQKYDADLWVNITADKYGVKDNINSGVWYITRNKYDCDYKIYFVKNKYDSDLIIYYVNSKYQAGSRRKI